MKFFLVHLHFSDSYSDKITIVPLGTGYILESLENNNVDVKYSEFSFSNNLSNLLNEIKEFSPTLIGFSFMSHFYKKSYEIINKVSELGIPIVCGGVHVNAKGESVINEVNTTFLIKGEGEKSLPLLIKNINNKKNFSKIPGLVYKENGETKVNPHYALNLEDIDFPKYNKFDLPQYSSNSPRLILSSRGCPYSCTYCQQSALLSKKWRKRSPEHIYQEIEYWTSRGITSFNFADDNLTLNRKRIIELCKIIKRKYKNKLDILTSGVRIDNVDYETLSIMRDCGFSYLSYGIESGSERVLKEIKKGITLSQIHKTLEMSAKLGFSIKLYFMINNRTETYEEVHASFKLSRQYPVVINRFTNLIPYPGTYDYEWIKKYGKLLYSPDDYLNDIPKYVGTPLYDGPGMSLEEREQVIREADLEIKKYEPTLSRKISYNLQLLKFGNYKKVAGKIFKLLGIS